MKKPCGFCAAALERGGGQLAQFSHPELGGYGQWMSGMTQIGDLLRVTRPGGEVVPGANDPSHGEHEPMLASFSEGPAALTKQSTMKPKPMSGMKPMSPMKPMASMKVPERWWPEELGETDGRKES